MYQQRHTLFHLGMDPMSALPISPEFAFVVDYLPEEYRYAEYYHVIQRFGTHFISKTTHA